MSDDPAAPPSEPPNPPGGAEVTTAELFGTIVPRPDAGPPDQTLRGAPPSLQDEQQAVLSALLQQAPPLGKAVDLVSVLGEGGMGIIHLGEQKVLQRQVAVKSVHPGANQDSARSSLLLEAFATAALDHPNIVPVHDLATDDDGLPHVIMRRIQGRTWSDYLRDPALIESEFGARDQLAWHLGVLMAVCNALHYAHSRGIIHRDLKPDNVMVGRFGEVLLLDWGIAARFTSDGPVRLPMTRDQSRLVGTPRFMAPEMARADGAALGPQTDVYMLGGLLHVVLTGRGPHHGSDIKATLKGIPDFRPQLPPGVPPRLAAILERAMAREPADRHPSAEALRKDLQAFLEERGADDLARQARQQLQALEHDLELDEPDREQVYRHFGACRFGFEQALQAWPDHPDATAGLRRGLTAMARFELDRGDAQAASLHLAAIEDPPADLVARRDALRQEQQRALDEAAALRADQDPRTGRRTRIFVFVLAMAVWTSVPLWKWITDGEVTYGGLLRTHAVVLLAVLGLVIWARDSMGRTTLNRRIAQLIVTVESFILLFVLVGQAAGLTTDQVSVIHQMLFAAICAMIADAVGPVALIPAVCFAIGAFVTATRPELIGPSNTLCNVVVVMLAWREWGRGLTLRHPPAGGS